jgi:hypothetical protein
MGRDPDAKPLAPAGADELIWRAVLVFGAILGALGALELAGLWGPGIRSTPESAFGTASAVFAGFPQLGLGLVFLLGGAVALGKRTMARAAAGLCVLTSLVLWLVAYLFVDALPYMLQVTSEPAVHLQVRKVMAKTSLEALLYPFLLLVVSVRGWRATLPVKAGRE